MPGYDPYIKSPWAHNMSMISDLIAQKRVDERQQDKLFGELAAGAATIVGVDKSRVTDLFMLGLMRSSLSALENPDRFAAMEELGKGSIASSRGVGVSPTLESGTRSAGPKESDKRHSRIEAPNEGPNAVISSAPMSQDAPATPIDSNALITIPAPVSIDAKTISHQARTMACLVRDADRHSDAGVEAHSLSSVSLAKSDAPPTGDTMEHHSPMDELTPEQIATDSPAKRMTATVESGAGTSAKTANEPYRTHSPVGDKGKPAPFVERADVPLITPSSRTEPITMSAQLLSTDVKTPSATTPPHVSQGGGAPRRQ